MCIQPQASLPLFLNRMKLTLIVELDDKQARALSNRVGDKETSESVLKSLIAEQTTSWASADFDASLAVAAEKLREQPLQVIDAVRTQVENL